MSDARDRQLSSERTGLTMFTKQRSIIWTESEEQRLMNSYKKVPTEKLLELFPGRTYKSLKQRAWRLNIPRKGLNYTPEEDRRLVELYYHTDLTYAQMSEYFTARSGDSLRVRMYEMRRQHRCE